MSSIMSLRTYGILYFIPNIVIMYKFLEDNAFIFVKTSVYT